MHSVWLKYLHVSDEGTVRSSSLYIYLTVRANNQLELYVMFPVHGNHRNHCCLRRMNSSPTGAYKRGCKTWDHTHPEE